MVDTFTKVGFIAVIIILVVFIWTSGDYSVDLEPKPATTIMVTTQPTTTISLTTTSTTTPTSDCSNAGFKLIEGSYAKSSAKLTLTLENTKSVDLIMEYVFLEYPNNAVVRKPIKGLLEGLVLEGHNTRSFLISQVEDKFISGQVTTNCPDVTIDFTYSDVT